MSNKSKYAITNRRIDHYRLTRRYGDHHYNEAIKELRAGKIHHLLKEIRRGDYGTEAKDALEEGRPTKVKPKRARLSKEPGCKHLTTQEVDQLKALGFL